MGGQRILCASRTMDEFPVRMEEEDGKRGEEEVEQMGRRFGYWS